MNRSTWTLVSYGFSFWTILVRWLMCHPPPCVSHRTTKATPAIERACAITQVDYVSNSHRQWSITIDCVSISRIKLGQFANDSYGMRVGKGNGSTLSMYNVHIVYTQHLFGGYLFSLSHSIRIKKNAKNRKAKNDYPFCLKKKVSLQAKRFWLFWRIRQLDWFRSRKRRRRYRLLKKTIEADSGFLNNGSRKEAQKVLFLRSVFAR